MRKEIKIDDFLIVKEKVEKVMCDEIVDSPLNYGLDHKRENLARLYQIAHELEKVCSILGVTYSSTEPELDNEPLKGEERYTYLSADAYIYDESSNKIGRIEHLTRQLSLLVKIQ
jgi:hypothetical protein